MPNTAPDIEPTDRTTLRRKPGRASYDRAVIDAILDECILCHVAVVIDGRPFVVPTAYARNGRWLYLHGAHNNRTLRAALEGEACISVTQLDGLVLARSILHHSMNYRSVVLFGKGEEVANPGEKFDAMRVYVEHVIPGRWDDARQPSPEEVEATLIIRFPIDECSAKVRTGPPEDADGDMELLVWAGVIPTRTAWLNAEPDPLMSSTIPIPNYVATYSRPSN